MSTSSSVKNPSKNQTLYPCIRYHDAPAAVRWLCEVFGFEEQLVVPGEGGTIAHAQLSLSSAAIMLGSARDDELGGARPKDEGGTGHGIYAYVDDVDAHHQRAKAAGAEILYRPRDTDYGSREYAAHDLEGNFWSFGTYRP